MPGSSSQNNHWTMRHGMPTRQSYFNYCPVDGRQFAPDETTCPQCKTDREAITFLGGKMDLELSFRSTSPAANKLLQGTSAIDQAGLTKPRWKKLLYIKQEYPDNYVDHTFLEEMQKNTNVRAYDYWSVVQESGVVTQHLSSIVIFVTAFIHVYYEDISIYSLITSSSALSLIAYIVWDIYVLQGQDKPRSRTKIFTGSVLFVMTLLGLSPILKTLTQDTSDDTIWALTSCFFCMNLLFHEYGSRSTANIKFPGSFSTNAAIFASVLLASRLPSNAHVFGLMLFAVQWFALFPIFRRTLKAVTKSYIVTFLLTVSLVGLTLVLLSSISKSILIIYAVVVLFITFVCPFWLIWIQRYKNAIQGPWDEARLVLSNVQ